MNKEAVYERKLDPRRKQAVAELTDIIRQRYPTATFAVGPGEDDPSVTHLTATVDVADPDIVSDLTIERELALQLDEGIPVFVIPLRTPERIAELVQRQQRPKHG